MLLKNFIDEPRATKALTRLMTLPVTVSRSHLLVPEAWTLRNNLIVQDAVYVVLARHLKAALLTGDQRLAAAPNLPIRVLHISAAR